MLSILLYFWLLPQISIFIISPFVWISRRLFKVFKSNSIGANSGSRVGGTSLFIHKNFFSDTHFFAWWIALLSNKSIISLTVTSSPLVSQFISFKINSLKFSELLFSERIAAYQSPVDVMVHISDVDPENQMFLNVDEISFWDQDKFSFVFREIDTSSIFTYKVDGLQTAENLSQNILSKPPFWVFLYHRSWRNSLIREIKVVFHKFNNFCSRQRSTFCFS